MYCLFNIIYEFFYVTFDTRQEKEQSLLLVMLHTIRYILQKRMMKILYLFLPIFFPHRTYRDKIYINFVD